MKTKVKKSIKPLQKIILNLFLPTSIAYYPSSFSAKDLAMGMSMFNLRSNSLMD